jgi:magnesium-transporting ATPase (P-type)
MSVIVRDGRNCEGNATLLVKGAAECVLARCSHGLLPSGKIVPLDAPRRAAIAEAVSQMAHEALRCLAVATRSLAGTDLGTYDGDHSHPGHTQLQDLSRYEELESGLTFVGLVGLQDPPRAEVKDAIAACTAAGIRVIVITGVCLWLC